MDIASGTRVHGSLPSRRRPTRSTEGSFSLNILAWCDKAKGRADLVVQKVPIDLLRAVVEMSPVGNPELWASNRSAVYGRETHNLFVEQLNVQLAADAANLTRKGNLKRGVKVKKASKAQLVEMYPLSAGKGYVGGRFKGNWQVSLNQKPVGETGRIDPSGSATLSAGTSVSLGAKAGDVIYLMNNVPYAIELEYGWSKQAPAGMVRVTVARFQQLVDQATRESKEALP